ncbi:MAG: sodium:calcium antiporter [Candidatus Pacebacteria bacterium]|nr:sodium:calcium antiporter [Candidatus Paceibacterota bacterium]
MSFIILVAVFIISCLIIYFAGEWVVDGIMNVARYLGWKEFVLSFLVMAFFGSLPNLFVGISSALQGIPELSLGEIISGNIINLTIVLALPILLMGKAIEIKSETIKITSFFVLGAIIFPVMLLLDGDLSRVDGLMLIFYYFSYIFWLFSKKERFKKPFDEELCRTNEGLCNSFLVFLKGLSKTVLGIALIIIAAQGIVWSSQGLAAGLNMPLILVGIFIVGFGNALPEIYFAIKCSEKDNTYMILGNLMGSVVTTATLVLGIVSFISPISIAGFENFALARAFLLVACSAFFIFSKTDGKVSKKEALALVVIYVLFLIVETLISTF